jgi:hypothetical protein
MNTKQKISPLTVQIWIILYGITGAIIRARDPRW